MTMEKQKIYLLIGPPGAGKTTWLNSQKWIQDHAIVSSDSFMEHAAAASGRTYTQMFDAGYSPTAIQLMNEALDAAFKAGRSVFVDQTNTTVARRARTMAKTAGAYHVAVVFKTPLDELVSRAHARTMASHKSIPLFVVQSMYDNMVHQPVTMAEGFEEIWYV